MDSFVGQEVSLKANTGRKKVFQINGILEQTYPKVFVVKFRERQVERRVSYSYADLLTEVVEISTTRDYVQTISIIHPSSTRKVILLLPAIVWRPPAQ